jgi:hypothetical protein
VASGFGVTVKLVDLVTGPLGNLNNNIESVEKKQKRRFDAALARGAAIQAQERKERLAAKGGLVTVSDAAGKVGSAFREIGDSIRDATSALGKFAPAIGTIGAAGTIAGVAALTKGFGNFGIQTTKTAAGLDLSVRDVQSYGRAFEAAGLSADEFASSHANINRSLVEARAGFNVRPIAAARYAESLGFGKVDLSGNAEQVRKQVADVIKKMHLAGVNVETQAQFAESFGISRDEISLLQRGGDAIQDLHDKAAATVVVSNELVDRGKELGQSAETAGYKIAGDLEPKLKPLIDGFASLLNNIDKLPGGMTTAETALGAFLGLFAVEVVLRLKSVGLALRGIAGAIGLIAGTSAPAWLLRLLGPVGAGLAAFWGGSLNEGENEAIKAHPELYPAPTPVHRRHGDIFRFTPEGEYVPGSPGAPPGAGHGPRQRRPDQYGGIPGVAPAQFTAGKPARDSAFDIARFQCDGPVGAADACCCRACGGAAPDIARSGAAGEPRGCGADEWRGCAGEPCGRWCRSRRSGSRCRRWGYFAFGRGQICQRTAWATQRHHAG